MAELYSKEAEESVLGSVLIDPHVITAILLSTSDFYIRRNGMVWEAMQRLEAARVPLDFVMVCDELEKHNHLQEIGGPAYLSGLINATPTSLHAKRYSEVVREYAGRRKALTLANELAKAATDTKSDFVTRQADFLGRFSAANKPIGGAVPVREWMERGFALVMENIANPPEVTGVLTGFRDLDKLFGALRAGVCLVGGGPGMGKSILVENIATWNAGEGVPGVLYSAEMSEEDMMYRMVSEQSGVLEDDLRSGLVPEDKAAVLSHTFEKVMQYPLYVSEAEGFTTATLRADLTRLKHERDIKWFVLDYLEMLHDRGADEGDRTKRMSKELARICRDLRLTGFVVQMMTKEGFKPGTGLTGFRGPSHLHHDIAYALIVNEHIPPPGQVVSQPNFRTITIEKARFKLAKGQSLKPIHLFKSPDLPLFKEAEVRQANVKQF